MLSEAARFLDRSDAVVACFVCDQCAMINSLGRAPNVSSAEKGLRVALGSLGEHFFVVVGNS